MAVMRTSSKSSADPDSQNPGRGQCSTYRWEKQAKHSQRNFLTTLKLVALLLIYRAAILDHKLSAAETELRLQEDVHDET